MPGALAGLHRLGVDPTGHPLRGISYRQAGVHADHLFRGAPGRGVRRTTLHAALRERADELGVEHRTARVAPAELVVPTAPAPGDGVEVAGVSARWLLACDGLHSTVRRSTGLDVPARSAGPLRPVRRYGLRRHFRLAPWTDLVEVHWGRRVEAYVTPVGPDLVGIALLGPAGVDFDRELADVPELADRLAGAEPAGPVRGAGPLRQRSRRRTLGPVRLVGDASGYVDALTGEGLRVGLAQASAAVAHLDDPEAYERAWVRATREYRLLTAGLVAWATSPARRTIVPLADRSPALYAAVVETLAR